MSGKRAPYVPSIGDVIQVWLGENVGHEQRARRPVVIVILNKVQVKENDPATIAVTCAVTTKSKDLPFEVPFELEGTMMYALSTHIHSIDVDASERKVKKIGTMPKEAFLQLKQQLGSFFA